MIWEWILFHANHDITNPGGHNRYKGAVTINVMTAPVFVGNNLFPVLVGELEVIRCRRCVVAISDRGIPFPVHLIQIFVPIGVLSQVCIISFKRDHNKQGLREVTIARRVNIKIAGVNDVHSRVVTNHLIYFYFLGTSNYSNGYLTSLVVIVHRLLDFVRGALLIEVRVVDLHLCSSSQHFCSYWICGSIIEGIDRHFFFDFTSLTTPADLTNTSTIIHGRADKIVHQLDLVHLGTELPVQQQLILNSSCLVFPGSWGDLKHLLSTEEWLSHGRIPPFSLATDELRLNRGTASNLGGFGLTLDIHQVVPTLNLGDLRVMR